VRPTRAATALIAAAATILTAGALPRAAADPLANAKAEATALTKTVNRLNTQAEVATERYDATESQLNLAVAEQGRAEQALTAVQATAATAQTTVSNHALALYETGGAPTLIASLLSGQSPNEALDVDRMATVILDSEHNTAVAAAATVSHAQVLDGRDATISRRVIKLQGARQTEASQVQGLLATQRRALADANGTVRRIMRADQAAEAAASAADFTSAMQAAGGAVNFTGTIAAPNNIAAEAIAAARSRIGVPYVWGATGPDSFDCSGLTQWSYAHAGIALPRTAAEQWNAGPHPALTDLEPGDLLFYALNTSDPATIHHVTMYIGQGLMLAAPHTGENVQIQPVYMAGFIGAMRPWGNLAPAS
jgi:cell wall-associated NlpC family hydrolase